MMFHQGFKYGVHISTHMSLGLLFLGGADVGHPGPGVESHQSLVLSFSMKEPQNVQC